MKHANKLQTIVFNLYVKKGFKTIQKSLILTNGFK